MGRDGAVFDARTFTGPQSLNDRITFDGSGTFLSDPAKGDLPIDMVRIAGSAQGVGPDRGTEPTRMDRAYAFSGTTTTDDWSPGLGNRTRITAVPEPSVARLMILDLVGFGVRRGRQGLPFVRSRQPRASSPTVSP